MAAHPDAEALADGAAVAVTGHQVARADQPLGARSGSHAHRGGHAVGILGEVRPARWRTGSGLRLARPLQEQRLEHLLRHEEPSRRAHVLDTLVDVRDVVGDLTAGERLDGVEPSVGVVERQRGGPHLGLDAGDAHELDGAELEVAGSGMDGRAVVLLDRQRLDPVLGEEHRRRQSDEAPTHDQHRARRHLRSGSGNLRSSSRPPFVMRATSPARPHPLEVGGRRGRDLRGHAGPPAARRRRTSCGRCRPSTR